jgi:hypothetical protein
MYLYNGDGHVVFRPLQIPVKIGGFFRSILNGEAFFYMQGDRAAGIYLALHKKGRDGGGEKEAAKSSQWFSGIPAGLLCAC